MSRDEARPEIPAVESIVPSTARLLRSVQATLQKITVLVGDEQARAELSMIDGVLSELASRDETDFYLAFYRAQRQLAVEGLALLSGNIDIAIKARIEAELANELPPECDPEASFKSIAHRITRVMQHLADLVGSAHENSLPEVKSFLARVTANEDGFHTHRVRFAQARQNLHAADHAALTAEKLQDYLQWRFPDRQGLRVTSFRQLVGGFQKVTILFETEDDSGDRDSLVMRLEKNDKFVSLDASDIRREYDIVKFVHAAGVPVAEPFWLEDDETKLGNRFFVSQRAPGENYGTAVSATGITDDIVRAHLEAISKLHRIPVSDAMKRLPIGRWLDFPNAAANVRANIAYLGGQPWMKATNPSPLAARLVNWLTDNAPEGDIPQCLIHCDYGTHNTLVHNGHVSAILDWETSRIGDPAQDVSWFLQGCGGQVDYSAALDLYEQLTGHRISEFRIRYYDVFGSFLVMVSNGCAASMYEAMEESSITWLNIPFRFAVYGTGTAEERICVAESVRGR